MHWKAGGSWLEKIWYVSQHYTHLICYCLPSRLVVASRWKSHCDLCVSITPAAMPQVFCHFLPLLQRFVLFFVFVYIKYKFAFSAFILLVWQQERHPACKVTECWGCWRGYLSGARCRLTWHMAQLMPLPFPFLVPPHPGCPGKRAVKRVCVHACVYVNYKFMELIYTHTHTPI